MFANYKNSSKPLLCISNIFCIYNSQIKSFHESIRRRNQQPLKACDIQGMYLSGLMTIVLLYLPSIYFPFGPNSCSSRLEQVLTWLRPIIGSVTGEILAEVKKYMGVYKEEKCDHNFIISNSYVVFSFCYISPTNMQKIITTYIL